MVEDLSLSLAKDLGAPKIRIISYCLEVVNNINGGNTMAAYGVVLTLEREQEAQALAVVLKKIKNFMFVHVLSSHRKITGMVRQ